MAYLQKCLLGILSLALVFQASNAIAKTALPEDKNKAVILAYHKIGEEHAPEQNLSLDQFKAHIHEIVTGNYTVLPLEKIITALQNDEALPTNTIAITFEGAHRSALSKAAPILQEARLPFTVFYASNNLDKNKPAFASWKELKSLANNENADIQTLPAFYEHTAHQDKQRILSSLNKARQRHREEFESEAKYLSYPFGEYSSELKILAQTQGFKAAFGLHSGAVYSGSDIYALPRFSMTGQYGDIERFRLVTKALPLPIKDLEPLDPLLQESAFYTGFTLPDALSKETNNLSCFISNQGKADIEKLGARIEIRSEQLQAKQNRVRLNCTIPGPETKEEEPQWRWLGLLYHRKKQSANTPQEDEPLPPRE